MFTINTGSGLALHIERKSGEGGAELFLSTDGRSDCLIHWGLLRPGDGSWHLPPRSSWPEGSAPFDGRAVRSPFISTDGRARIRIPLTDAGEFRWMEFVLFFPTGATWDNNGGRNYRIDLPGDWDAQTATVFGDPGLAAVAGEIIGRETSRNSWTLMHRFDLCHDLLDRIGETDVDGAALIFAWLRFSFIRQLDWQRNYNTKPRELSHALDRLTLKLARRYTAGDGAAEMIRLAMTTLGRGGEGQRVRDEVLNIMHRHHIKEVSGHFMEEWHQKLHNNTTPDDVVICEAYLDFLRGGGNLDRFYLRLEEGGVTKERLESYERPIRSHPDFVPHLKDALIHDFGDFLGVLKSVHTGTDLGTAMHAARHHLDAEMNGMLDFIWVHREDGKLPLPTYAAKITAARRRLKSLLNGHEQRVRDLLFLDLALEDFFRLSLERNLDAESGISERVDLLSLTLENICLSSVEGRFDGCRHYWDRLRRMQRFGREWSLQAKAAADLIGRELGRAIDRYHRLLQPKAEFLGKAFHAAAWSVDTFTEEVVRGRPLFILSVLLHSLDPVLRKAADLGDWQVISPGSAVGRLEKTNTMTAFRNRQVSGPVVLVVDHLTGYEDIPVGVKAILTPVSMDILSHLAVRARNAGILFATCFDKSALEAAVSLLGRVVRASVDARGDVIVEEGQVEQQIPSTSRPSPVIAVPAKRFTAYAIGPGEFSGETVGGKSANLKRLQDGLPDWISVPSSAALPFGVFERVLDEEINRAAAGEYTRLTGRLGTDEDTEALLSEVRSAVLSLKAPEGLISSVTETMASAGLAGVSDWESSWMSIKRVWASKWNDRAYQGRISRGLSHDQVFMAVLIQRLIEAEYSFVVHTVNPFSGADDEIYAEAVRGLGEALVGNYPGRALGFTCKKNGGQPRLLSFPSKGSCLTGTGLIFRSDSNDEDLPDYAGAGVYDSYILPEPRKRPLDYIDDPLIWDAAFRKEFLVTVAKIGQVVEDVFADPQDIEGVYAQGRYSVVQSRRQAGAK